MGGRGTDNEESRASAREGVHLIVPKVFFLFLFVFVFILRLIDYNAGKLFE